MSRKVKILIVGIGGVGGYFGGMLAKKYENSSKIEICFGARGEHLNKIKANGLKVIHGREEFIARPSIVSDNTNKIGIADYILICTKSYDLDATLEQLNPCVGENTILLPLLNGVESVERIQNRFPGATVLEGCVYIVSQLKEAGVIENSGINQLLYFGPDTAGTQSLLMLEKLLKEAGIEATLSDKISTIVWEKFIFISAIATATSYLDYSLGKLLETNEKTLVQLIEEVKSVALAKGISINPEITARIVNYNKLLPYETTSSMHRDYQNRKPNTEVETLTGYVVWEGRKLKIPTPLFSKAYTHLTGRNGE